MCTIGGNLAENSGGLRCVKYGVTRDWVLGLEVVLADGSVIRTGGKNMKDVAGYDLTGWFVGSEGTLGLITEATLRLLPMPPPKLTMLAFFATVRDAGEAVAADHRRGHPAGHARADGRVHDRRRRRRPSARPGPHRRRDADGRVGPRWRRGAKRSWPAPRQACLAAGATSVAHRRRCPGGRLAAPGTARGARLARAGGRGAHGRRRRAAQPRARDARRDRARSPRATSLPVGVFGHAGDGNLHPDLHPRPRRPDRRASGSTRRATRSIAPRWSWVAPSPASTARGSPRSRGWSSSAASVPSR